MSVLRRWKQAVDLSPVGLLLFLVGCGGEVAGPGGQTSTDPVGGLSSVVQVNGFQTFTDRAAWETAVAAAGGSVTNLNFAGLTLGRVTQLDTDYGVFRIVVDQLSASEFSNPGISIFSDASCSLGSGDCMVFTFNMQDPTSLFDAPRVNEVIFPSPITAFGGDFIQAGVTAPAPGSVTGPVTLHFGGNSVVVNDFLDANGNGFFGVIVTPSDNEISFTFAKSGSLQNDIFQVFNPAIATGAAEQPADEIADLAAAIAELGLPSGTVTSFNAKLNAALTALNSDNVELACSKLQDFINAVAAQSGKKVTAADAATLIAGAQSIRALLGC